MCWEFNRFFIKKEIKKPLSTVLCSVVSTISSWSTQQVVRNTWLHVLCFPLQFVSAQLCSFCSVVSAYNRTEHNQSFFINFVDKNQSPWVVNFQTLAFLHKSSFLHLPCCYREAHYWKNTLQICMALHITYCGKLLKWLSLTSRTFSFVNLTKKRWDLKYSQWWYVCNAG